MTGDRAVGFGRAWVLLAATLAVALGGQAALQWAATSTITTRAQDPPVAFELGDQAGDARWFATLDLSTNATSFTAEVDARAGATMVVTDAVRLAETGGAERSVTFTGSSVSNARIEAFDWDVRNDTASQATVDHLAASPSASFTLPADTTYELDLRVDLADGAGSNNATATADLDVEVT
jgi:hypothetical protein